MLSPNHSHAINDSAVKIFNELLNLHWALLLFVFICKIPETLQTLDVMFERVELASRLPLGHTFRPQQSVCVNKPFTQHAHHDCGRNRAFLALLAMDEEPPGAHYRKIARGGSRGK
jgi:hypothetical protein